MVQRRRPLRLRVVVLPSPRGSCRRLRGKSKINYKPHTIMKKYCLSLITLWVCIIAQAGIITKQSALKEAQRFRSDKSFVSMEQEDEKGYYIFNTVYNQGFVIVGGDDEHPEVLGWSDTGSIDMTRMSDGLKWLLECYEQTARSHRLLNGVRVHAPRAPRQAVHPLLQTRWSQWAPYNNMCPELNGQRCLTGCVATALAQVINYTKWPEGPTSAIDQLITTTHQLRLPPLEPTTFDWDNMTTDDIARLMLYCGQAVGMDYGLEASGANPQEEVSALKRVFGYSRDTRFVFSSDYSSADWEQLLYDELKNGRPIIYNGYTKNNEGHSFVVHGYEDGRFYINWGWGGQGDGYFTLTNLDSGNAVYSQGHCATIGIHSSENDPVETAKAEVTNLMSLENRYYSFNDYLWVSGLIRNVVPSQPTLKIGLGLYNINDQLQKVLWEEEHEFQSGEQYWFGTSFQIDNNLTPGAYRIMPISRASDSETWEPDRGAQEYYLELTVLEHNLFKIRCFPLSDIERNTVDLGVKTIDGITYDLYAVNGKNYALVLPPESGKYKGDFHLPDAVSYEGRSYRLYKAIDATFSLNPELTSLSTSMYFGPYISGCENLTRLELREGVTRQESEIYANKLKSLEFPSTVTIVSGGGAAYCQQLSTIRFNNPRSFTMTSFPQWYDDSTPALRDVYFLTDEPPLFSWKDGDFIPNPKVTIHIPKGSLSNWKNSDWRDWNFVEDQEPIFTGIEWGYNTNDNIDGNSVPSDVGENYGEYAIRIPAEMLAPMKGNTISTIRFNTCYQGYDYMFITTTGKDYLMKQDLDINSMNWDWNTVSLDTPFTITGEELFIGLGRYGSISTNFSTSDTPSPDGFYIRAMGSGEGLNPIYYEKFVNMTNEYPLNLPLRIIITGNNFPTDIQVSNAQVITTDNPIRFTTKVTNRTSKVIQKYTISWTLDGKTQENTTITTQLAGGKSENVTIELPSIKGKNHTMEYAVTDIDGQNDAVTSNSSGAINFQLPTTTFYPRVTVMEEATGTWCGWCVRGIETIQRLNSEYPDNFIAIGIHNSDEMANWVNYDGVAKRFSSYPNSLINRQEMFDPDYPGARQIVEYLKNSAEAQIKANALFVRSDSSAVKVTTETTFGFSDEGRGDYRIAYVVVEDQVGPYPQNNYYDSSQLSPDDYMYRWTQLPGRVDILFNDVARAIYSDTDGLKGSIPAIIEEGKVYQYTYGFNLPKNIQNYKNIRIVTLLIDNTTGEIMNAAQTPVTLDTDIATQTFALTYQGEQLPDYASVIIEAEEDEHGDVMAETNPTGSGAKGLLVTTLNGNRQQGKAILEVLSSTLQAGQIQWCMGGDCVPITLQQPVEKTFTTDESGKAQVMFDVAQIKQYGSLEARLTITIGNETHQAVISVVYEQPVIAKTNFSFHETALYTGKRYTSADFPDIKSGSFKIAKNGRTITFTNLVTDSDMQEGSLFDLWDDATVILEGENNLNTQGHVVITPRKSFTITGDGSLTTKSTWYDFWVHGNDFTIDNTTVTCLGLTAVGNNMMPCGDNLVIKSSTFKGHSIFRLSSLVLIGCHFDSPQKIIYDGKEEGGCQLKYEDGTYVYDFTIVPSDGNFQYVVAPSPLGKVYLDTGSQRTVYVTCQNQGTESVKSVTYVTTIDGVSQGAQSYTLTTPVNRIGGIFEVPVTFIGTPLTGIQQVILDITHVNGQPNQAEEHIATATLVTVSQVQSHRIVVEEFTGTWCGWCTRGIIGLEMLNRQFGDRVITIAAHGNDPMQNDDYSFIFALTNSYPSCVINRGPLIDPYWGSSGAQEPFGIANDIERELAVPVIASIEAEAAWADAAKTAIRTKTSTTFGVDVPPSSPSPYQLGFILVADGLKGTGADWAQNNIYSDMGTGDANLLPIESQPDKIVDIEYNHVGIGTWGAQKGIEGSIAATIVKDQPQHFIHVCNVADNTLVQDKNRLSMVALILDAQTGTIINAAKCKVADYDPAGIHLLTMPDAPSPMPIYDLSGRKIGTQHNGSSMLKKGLYISNGKKMIVK